jgi:hypothetical protein
VLVIVGHASEALAREPTEQEQYFVEMINRARLDPAAEVAFFGLGSLNEGPPTLGGEPYTIPDGPHQPVAINPLIMDAASDYAILLNDNDFFGHVFDGKDSSDRMFAAGYVDQLSDFASGAARYTGDYGTTTRGFVPGRENLSLHREWPSNGRIDVLTLEVEGAHQGLFVDDTVPSRGHRSTMMYGEFKEVGVGIDVDTDFLNGDDWDSLYIVTNFAHRSDRGPFITGVAYDDLDQDGFYTPDAGEALGAVTVSVYQAGTSTLVDSTTTFASGGYSVEVPIGTYDVRFSGSGVSGRVNSVEVLASVENGTGENTKVDYVPEPAPGIGALAALVTLTAIVSARRGGGSDHSR